MAPYWPLYLARSDGKLEIVKGKKREINEPTPEQLDRTPDKTGMSDFYRLVEPHEVKHLDWRRKLGGMMLRELGGAEHAGKSGILAALPENYRLYEHVKTKVADAPTTATAAEDGKKTHAGGGHERQDAYLYGHPIGRKKRFRSPADFFPHLLWLATDASGDADNCSCKMCAPEDIQGDEKPAPKSNQPKNEPAVKPEGKVSVRTETQAITASQPGGKKQAAQEIKPQQPPAKAPQTQPRSTTQPTPTAPSQIQQPQQPLVPQPLPPAPSEDQRWDRAYNTFMYRQGEIVWFNRGQAWGLGLLIQRYHHQTAARNQEPRFYRVQPLSNPFQAPEVVVLTGDDSMRPWLAWSVPPYTHAALNEMQVTYDTADWKGILQKTYGNGDAEVDGSIMAARHIDTTYHLFEIVSHSKPVSGSEEIHWNGIFIGAEKIWTGDPIRLKTGMGNDIMVLLEIIERIQPGYRGAPPKRTIQLVGDVYTLETIMGVAPEPTHLPPRVIEDLRIRNTFSLPVRSTSSTWKLIHSQVSIDLSQVKGRWYEATLLLPILQPAIFQDSIAKGEIPEAGALMNTRASSTRAGAESGTTDTRTATRLAACGRSVPNSTIISSGVDDPRGQLRTVAHAKGLPPADPPQEQQESPFDQFMNLGVPDNFNTAYGSGESNLF